jgi:hypothetical protein
MDRDDGKDRPTVDRHRIGGLGMPKCKACGADIDFIRTSKGKRMPVDRNPNPLWAPCLGTTVVVRLRTKNAEVIKVQTDGAVIAEAWVPHWVTCTRADEFRKE